jgi:hypothetical protein
MSPATFFDGFSKTISVLEKAHKIQMTALGEASEINKTHHTGQVETVEITRGMPPRPEKPLYEEES